MNFERSGDAKKSIGIGHQAINLKLIAIKFDEKNYFLPDDETHELLKELSREGRIPWHIVDRNLPRRTKEGDKFGFLVLSEDEFKLGKDGGKVYKSLFLSFIQSRKVIFKGGIYEIPQIFSKKPS